MRLKDSKAKGGKATNGKAIVRRELKSVLTSGTLVEGSMLSDDLSNHCVAIKEHTPNASSPPSFGVCILDASTAEFSLSQFSDDASRTHLETIIRQLKPKEIIHEKGNLSVSTLRLLRNSVGVDCQWTALKAGTEFLRGEETKRELRKLFAGGDGEGMEVDEEGQEEDKGVPENIRVMYEKEIAMSALGGMIWYLRQLNLDSDLVTAKNFNIYDPLSQGKALILDGQTLAHIEVLQNSQAWVRFELGEWLMDLVSGIGKRLFKIWLCAPLREAAAINDRLDAVDDLLANQTFGAVFDKMSKKLPDLERLLSRIHAKSCKKQEFIKVIASFSTISDGLVNLATMADDFKSKGIAGLLRNAPDLQELIERIEGMYDGEELLPVDGADEDYETVRQNVVDIEESLQEVLEKAKVSLNCTKLEFKDIGTKDIYQIQVPAKIKTPNSWTKMSGTKDFHRYYNSDIIRLVQDLKEARERKLTVVNDFQFKVYGEFDRDYSVWLNAVKVVAELDCLLSLSKSSAALGEPSVRPEIIEADTAIIEFEELRHPCVLSASTDFIANDVGLGGEAEQMILLTGPNMAGKSTMLRMTCAAIIMAQLGCHVPASKARIAPTDAIYSRMGANDFIFANASTFKVEMDDCNKILTKATPKSLVILDELGRGTSTYDGMAIAFAVLHRLATHVGCIGFFATHFTSLTEDFAYHPQIRLCQMATQVDDETKAVTFLYRLALGASPKSYGPHVARMAGLPDSLVERAINISKEFETSSRAHERAMRASESLALTSQADGAFLVNFAKLGMGAVGKNVDPGQLLRTLKIIRASVVKQREAKAMEVV
ncbi:DNA mismatch repair protein MSH6, partial [Phenoliferia sp. Uapishka_3]